MTRLVFMNDRFVPEEGAQLHFRDLSFQRGYGIFDFFRLAGALPLFLDDHLTRFYESAGCLRLAVPMDRTRLRTTILELIDRNQWLNSGVRLSLTGGYSEDGFTIGKPNLLISQHGFTEPTDAQRTAGLTLLPFGYQRQLPQAKTIDYLTAIWLQREIRGQDADDVLYHDQGFVTECPRSNFFLVTENETIVTPAQNVLAGVTRKKLIELARKDFRVEERPVSLKELGSAREAFVTSTTRQVMPVSRIGTTVFPQNRFALHLQQAFRCTYVEKGE